MTSDSLPLRVTRLENDTEAIYEILTVIDARLSEHDTRFDKIDARLSEHDTRFDKIDARFDQAGAALGEVLRRLPGTA